MSGVEGGHRVVEIRQTAFGSAEQFRYEAVGARHLFPDDRFPKRRDLVVLARRVAVNARRHDAVVVNAETAGKNGEHGGIALVQMSQDTRMLGEKRQRLVVQTCEPAAE